MRRMFLDFANVRILRSYFAQPQTLAEFQVAQENWQHDLFQRAQQQAQKVRSAARRKVGMPFSTFFFWVKIWLVFIILNQID